MKRIAFVSVLLLLSGCITDYAAGYVIDANGVRHVCKHLSVYDDFSAVRCYRGDTNGKGSMLFETAKVKYGYAGTP